MPRPSGMGTPGAPQAHANMYNPPRPPEVYTLPDNINETLPATVRREFQHDDYGRVLFFSAAPLDRSCNGLSPLNAKGSEKIGMSCYKAFEKKICEPINSLTNLQSPHKHLMQSRYSFSTSVEILSV
ncbi:hypothetical protein Trco_002193 [Trichoderma cornu-damae]|uniref:Uncharacterized protein n=1 Tax=Trichoderma cornu-damae TaxID=654480 RepID=A0A9P8QUJ9_9HYPO|nr:hypothetical protein Trco_002193 [Trichoderma cornu-damae]